MGQAMFLSSFVQQSSTGAGDKSLLKPLARADDEDISLAQSCCLLSPETPPALRCRAACLSLGCPHHRPAAGFMLCSPHPRLAAH